MQAKIVLASVALLVVGVLLTAGQAGCQGTEQSQQKLPKLFDFDFYKERFGKTYGSLLENLDRKRLFFSRAFQAFVSGTKYKLRLQSHYNALNDMSDWSQAELDSMLNKRLMESGKTTMAREDDDDASEDARELLPDSKEKYEQELAQMIEEHGDEPGFEELKAELEGGKRRAKRNLAPREFSFDKLIAGNAKPEPPSEKLRLQVPSNNPDYEPLELPSFGFRNTEKLKWHTVEKRDSRPFIVQAREYVDSIFKREWGFKSSGQADSELAAANGGPDVEMFVDLRTSGCLTPVARQLRCGSCWAFSTTTVMEWLYCNQTGTLTAFSQQYLVDCGIAAKFLEMRGCEGAVMPDSAFWFVNNFGMELAKNYPYRALDGVCPYEDKEDAKKMGYIRTPIKNVAKVHISRWEEVIAHGPLVVDFATSPGFHSYGGGVFEGKDCKLTASHSMVLVGHGREEGREFWLIRNSHGIFWGESGYIKLSKKYARRCLAELGFALGSKDGINYEIQFAMSDGKRPNKEWQQRNKTLIDKLVG